ncbi:MAG: hypothetical protein NTZ95_03685 [Candidatus Omnitrophica bacterium]|nr:hypothetical protein [Candidatus Omnitrophota bacterium]
MNIKTVPLVVEETCGIDRFAEPVSVGVPLPKCFIYELSQLRLFNNENQALPFQISLVESWSDASAKWVLLDFQISVQAYKTAEYYLSPRDIPKPVNYPVISTICDENTIAVDTSSAKFFLSKGSFRPFEKIEIEGRDALDRANTKLVITDEEGREREPKIERIFIETEGPLRTTIRTEGYIDNSMGKVLVKLYSRTTFFAGKNTVKIEYTIRNPRRAKHPGGFWDLGDAGSVYYKDLSVYIALSSDAKADAEWIAGSNKPASKVKGERVEIYQDSSGGKNWASLNHINRFGRMTNSFCGYRIHIGEQIAEEGERAEPVVMLKDGDRAIHGAIVEFWQNFPKAIEIQDNNLIFRLFPRQYNDIFELQGGEQKTQVIFLSFEDGRKDVSHLRWIHSPLIPRCRPEWYSASNAFCYFVPEDDDPNLEQNRLIETAVNSKSTFFDRIEAVDEYGWRNFGDLFADHETKYYKGGGPLISHYNNQYDVVYGALIQYLKSGDRRWYTTADRLVRHVIDIDIYHTDKDKTAYNNGMFWHTMHSTTAYTSTHRCYSRKVLNDANAVSRKSGGPSNEHNYTSGLRYYYYLTGNPQAKEAVLSLAEWVIDMDDGSKTIFGLLDDSSTGLSTKTADFSYHGPGRGAGNSINALIDAGILTGEKRYLSEAEKLIKRCIHPDDDILRRGLSDPEKRWSYVVFLQILGKYLDRKEELGEKGYAYCYARESLLHYTKWMADNEYVYLERPEKLEYPTETWAAQEMRKTNVFLYAAKYSNDILRKVFLKKAEYFYESSIKGLLSFKNNNSIRSIAILLSCGSMYAYFKKNMDEKAGDGPCKYKFQSSRKFIPQKIKIKRRFWILILLLFINLVLYLIFPVQ